MLADGACGVPDGVEVTTVFVPVIVWFARHVSLYCMIWLFVQALLAVNVWPESLPPPEHPVPCIVMPEYVVSVAVTVYFAFAPAAHDAVIAWPTSLPPLPHDVPFEHDPLAAAVSKAFAALPHCVAFSQVASFPTEMLVWVPPVHV